MPKDKDKQYIKTENVFFFLILFVSRILISLKKGENPLTYRTLNLNYIILFLN